MRYLHVMALAATALAGAATAASAQQAYTTDDAGMRAGPGMRYPLVRVVPGDAVVYIHGCLRNWDWCDVSWRRSRGWVFSDDLEGIYRNRRIAFDRWRGNVEVPFVTFGFGYWDRYYRDRPWYGSWERWGDRNDRSWRQRHRDSGDGWNDNGNTRNRTGGDGNGGQTTRRERHRDNNPDDNNSNANDNIGNGNGEPTARRERHRDSNPNDNNSNRKGNTGNTGNDDRRMQCAPDDPSCNTTGNDGRKRRGNQQSDGQPMEVQPQ